MRPCCTDGLRFIRWGLRSFSQSGEDGRQTTCRKVAQGLSRALVTITYGVLCHDFAIHWLELTKGHPKHVFLPLFGQSQTSSNFFLGGLRPPPPDPPPSSRLLSQPPQARFERLSQVGHCRSLQGWGVLGQWFEMQITEQPGHLQPGLQVSELFSGPHPGTFVCKFSPHFQKMRKNNVDPADPTIFFAFPGNA